MIWNNKEMFPHYFLLTIPLTIWALSDNKCYHYFHYGWIKFLHVTTGFVGPLLSSNAKYVAEFLSDTNIPVVTPSATLAELRNKLSYNTLLMTAASDDKQSKVI